MRKILSILVALGLVLTFSVVAMPTTGAACTATVVLSNDCASATGVTYNITFTSPKTLLAGNDKLSFEFATGTAFGTFVIGDVTIELNGGGAANVPLASITKAAPNLDFVVPGQVDAGDAVEVIIKKVTNPAVHGAKVLNLDYEFACCGPEVFDCADYTIKPAISTYELLVDFGPTYPGIAEGFIPPFKACGQNDTGADFNTTYIAPNWYDQFDLILAVDVEGCAPPCVNATLYFDLTAFPTASAVASLNISGEFFALNSTSHNGTLSAPVVMNASADIIFDSLLHFDTVGDYTICFWVECPGTPGGTCPVCDPGAPTIIAEACFDFEVHQWKDAGKITLEEKWNLISLPLVPFDTDIDVLLASLSAAGLADLVSIWSYDTATATWTMYSGGGLTEMEDGKGYWVRMDYPIGSYDWWVWGTARAMPPAAPSAYPVVPGWNMFGFTSLVDLAIDPGAGTYLWNFSPLPLVYGWNNTGDWTTSGWLLKPTTSTLNSGQGYWGYFTAAGTIVPP